MKRLIVLGASLLLSLTAQAADTDTLQPFVLAYVSEQPLVTEFEQVKSRLADAELEVIGQYSPWEGAHVLAVTHPQMQQIAAQSASGGFAAVNHVALTQVGEQVQVSYLNSAYMAAAYRATGVAEQADAALRKALGAKQVFGTAQGRSAEQLGAYHYMMGMEYFTDSYDLAEHRSHAEALDLVEKNLASGVAGVRQVYRQAIAGTEQVVFGVSRAQVADKRANDAHILRDTVDAGAALKTTAYLPYQLLVDGKQVRALHMRFRMAVYHPDLTMTTFGKLMSSPGAIEDVLRKVAGGKKESRFF